eukprot:7179118-Prymnesium_polylepis.1
MCIRDRCSAGEEGQAIDGGVGESTKARLHIKHLVQGALLAKRAHHIRGRWGTETAQRRWSHVRQLCENRLERIFQACGTRRVGL